MQTLLCSGWEDVPTPGTRHLQQVLLFCVHVLHAALIN